MDSMTLFSNNEHNTSQSALDPNKMHCAAANLHSTLGFGFSYQWIECHPGNTNEAYRLCFKNPEGPGCSAPSVTTSVTTMTTTTTICSCEPPWFEAKETKAILGVTNAPCYANMGLTDGWDDKCSYAGGYTIYFTSENQGFEGLFLQTLLSQGKPCPIFYPSLMLKCANHT